MEREGWDVPPPVGAAVAWLGWVVGGLAVARAVGVSRAHGYAAFSPSTLAEWEATARSGLELGLPLLAALLVPWWWVRRRGGGPRTLARAWAILLVGGVWAWRGYVYNRYEVGALWRRSSSVLGQSVPSALTDGGVLATNLGLTLGALLLLPVVGAVLVVGMRRLRPRRLAALRVLGWGLAGLTLVGAVHPERLWRTRPAGPDLILVSLDAVRADRLGCYGYERETTPHLDRLASESIRFARAYSQEPWTLTSHMSMLTGLYPDAHGLDFGRSLAPSVWTVAERLRDAGYRTWGSVYDCFLLNPQFGYDAGFDHYEVNGLSAHARGQRAADWLLASNRPAFVFLHFYDPHTDTGAVPYEASAPFRDRLAPGAAEALRAWVGPGGASESLREFNEGTRPLTDVQRGHLSRLYDASLAECDAAFGAFLDRLRAAGRLEDALVLVLSDHGEALGERDHAMHEELMDATLHIPLLLRRPGGREGGTVRPELVETVDVAPTLLAAAGVAPEPLCQGQSLLDPVDRALAYHRSGPDYAASTEDGWRIAYRWEREGPRWVSLRRYGVGPADGPDQLATAPEVPSRWRPTLLRWHDSNRAVAERFRGRGVSMSAEDEELLRSLGYID